jgi:N-acetylmuramoyl-L-alanine amidase
LAKVSRIVIHCSDSPDNLDISVAEIRQWHMKDRGWKDIGYHAVARRGGIIELGRYEDGDSILEGSEIGAHVRGANSDSLAICIVGRKDFPKAQMTVMLKHVVFWLNAYGLTVDDVKGHYELDPGKTCPNLDMGAVRESLRAMMAQKVG